ncbi:MAG: DUF1080 domain-containing protein [Tannerella sp.]|jgi:hypothetical protein|nr:DUF1080 domain-containing protein [Tannerella sp.]
MKKYFLPAVIAIMCCSVLSSVSAQEERLFNGKDLSNWEFVVDGDSVPGSQVYSVQNGEILIQGRPFGYMYTKKTYRNYTLNVEWAWVDEPTNSGIFVIIAQTTNPFPNGIEVQLAAGNAGDFVMLGGSDMVEFKAPEDRPRPRFPVVRKKEATNEKVAGEWNKAKIIVNEGKITVYINDVFQNEGTCPVKEGHIGLQSEGKRIKFRNVTATINN